MAAQREATVRIRRNVLWTVPAFCIVAGIIAFNLYVRLFGRFTLLTLPDGSITADNGKVLLIHGIILVVSILVGGLCFRGMTRKEIFLSGTILVLFRLLLIAVRWFMGSAAGSLGFAFIYLSILSEWSHVISGLIFSISGSLWQGALVEAFAPYLFILFGKKEGQNCKK